VYLFIYLIKYLLIHTYEKIEIEMLLYTLTKKFIEIQGKMLNAFVIICFTKWCGLMTKTLYQCEANETKVQSPLPNILCGICIFVYIPCTYV